MQILKRLDDFLVRQALQPKRVFVALPGRTRLADDIQATSIWNFLELHLMYVSRTLWHVPRYTHRQFIMDYLRVLLQIFHLFFALQGEHLGAVKVSSRMVIVASSAPGASRIFHSRIFPVRRRASRTSSLIATLQDIDELVQRTEVAQGIAIGAVLHPEIVRFGMPW